MKYYNRQFNKYYKNIIYENKNWRLYDENTTDSYTALYSETQIKLIELIEKYDFKIFYFNCAPKTELKINFEKDKWVELNDNNIISVKKMLSEDLYYLYKNQLFEVIYTFPKLNSNNNYYFDMLLVVNNNFNLNILYNYNFNLININSIQQILQPDITYEWVENKINGRQIFHNSSPHHDENYISGYYDLYKVDLSFKDYVKNNNIKDDKWEWGEYQNASSLHFYKNFNQNLYVKNCFMLLDMQIWSLDRQFVKLKNNFGYLITYWEKYNINSGFVTNFIELIGGVSVNINKNKNIEIKEEYCTYCSLRDNFNDQHIVEGSLNKKAVQTGFIDVNSLEFEEEKNIY